MACEPSTTTTQLQQQQLAIAQQAAAAAVANTGIATGVLANKAAASGFGPNQTPGFGQNYPMGIGPTADRPMMVARMIPQPMYDSEWYPMMGCDGPIKMFHRSIGMAPQWGKLIGKTLVDTNMGLSGLVNNDFSCFSANIHFSHATCVEDRAKLIDAGVLSFYVGEFKFDWPLILFPSLQVSPAALLAEMETLRAQLILLESSGQKESVEAKRISSDLERLTKGVGLKMTIGKSAIKITRNNIIDCSINFPSKPILRDNAKFWVVIHGVSQRFM